MSGGGFNQIDRALAVSRSRSSWNSWLAQAEKPASNHEEAKIQRAASMATSVVQSNRYLVQAAVRVLPQGSYFNNTNTRNEADMDLRVQMNECKIEYGIGVDWSGVYSQHYSQPIKSLEQISAEVRVALTTSLIMKFGLANVDVSGNKAIRVHGLDGSRADCDLVPAFNYHFIHIVGGSLYRVEGVAILGDNGTWTINFPEQHYANGVAKRSRTSHRFKRNVRMLKRLNYELEEVGDIHKRLPSFLIECLIHAVEDEHFLTEDDDRFLRLLRILTSLEVSLRTPAWCESATEINGIKRLFAQNQPWNVAQVQAFVQAAMQRLVA